MLGDLRCYRDSRQEDAERYWSGEISYQVLLEESPFVALELRRQGRLCDKEA